MNDLIATLAVILGTALGVLSAVGIVRMQDVYIRLQVASKASSLGIALLSVFCGVITAWSWFGVNQLGVGLHSYGFTEGVLMRLGIFVAAQLVGATGLEARTTQLKLEGRPRALYAADATGDQTPILITRLVADSGDLRRINAPRPRAAEDGVPLGHHRVVDLQEALARAVFHIGGEEGSDVAAAGGDHDAQPGDDECESLHR